MSLGPGGEAGSRTISIVHTAAMPLRRFPGFPAFGWVAGAAIAAAMLIPPAYLVLRAAQDGFAAWDTLARSATIEATIRTARLAATTAAGTVVLAVPIAWLTTRTDLPFRRVWTVLLALPLAIPSYVAAFVLVGALGPAGLWKDALGPLGIDSVPSIYGFWGAWFALTFFTYPYVLLPVRAAFQGMDPSLEEAARGLGKGPFQTFARVTVPQLGPAIAAGALLVALYALSDFGAVSILRFNSLSRLIYLEYTGTLDRSAAAALALILVAMAVSVVSLEGFVRGRARFHTRTHRRAASTVRLGPWRWPALAFCSSVALASVGMPLLVMGTWLWRGISNDSAFDAITGPAWNSLYVSGLAGIVAVAASIPIAYLVVRRRGVAAETIDKASQSGFALPGIAVALALVFFGANYAPWVYQTLALLVFAYVVRFLPQALGATRASFLQVDPHTEEAARSLGGSAPRVFARITLPQLVPGMWAGGALVFLTTMKELPVTLLLSPLGFDTLATQIWANTNEALFARAALPALILVLLSSLPMILTVLRERTAR
ncbi:MAG: iron ABC transporter permease [Dehalococcoidia bacterium]